MNLWVRPFFGESKPFPIVQQDFGQFIGGFSPDNGWIVYESNESGRSEVYVQSFPEAGEKRQISSEGGGDPRWRADGKEVFYIAPDGKLMAASISMAAGQSKFSPESPRRYLRLPLSLAADLMATP